MKIRYTRGARNDLRLISGYLREHAPEAAQRVGSAIRARISQLEKHPYLGTATSEMDIRSLKISRYPYTVYYRVGEQSVSIMHIRHQSRAPWGGAR